MLKLLKISGDSLTPDYQNGDFVIISKIPFFFKPPTHGDVVAFRQPGYGLLIKRIESVRPNSEVVVIGSHPESIDSRVFGAIRIEDILGKVVWHIRKG